MRGKHVSKARRWTMADDARLVSEYPHAVDAGNLAAALGRTVQAVRARAERMGLRKTVEVLRQQAMRNLNGTWSNQQGEDDDEDDKVPRVEIVERPAPGILRSIVHRCR